MRAALVLAIVVLAGGIGAQTPTITPTTVVYEWRGSCDGNPTTIRPVLQATGGSGNYTWTALTAPPANLTLNTDGTFSGDIDHVVAGPAPWTFDVEVLDTTSMNTAQATITMIYVSSSPGCTDDDGGCASGTRPGAFVLMLLAVFALCVRLITNTPGAGCSRGA